MNDSPLLLLLLLISMQHAFRCQSVYNFKCSASTNGTELTCPNSVNMQDKIQVHFSYTSPNNENSLTSVQYTLRNSTKQSIFIASSFNWFERFKDKKSIPFLFDPTSQNASTVNQLVQVIFNVVEVETRNITNVIAALSIKGPAFLLTTKPTSWGIDDKNAKIAEDELLIPVITVSPKTTTTAYNSPTSTIVRLPSSNAFMNSINFLLLMSLLLV